MVVLRSPVCSQLSSVDREIWLIVQPGDRPNNSRLFREDDRFNADDKRMGLTRRTVLHQLGVSLAALGLDQTGLSLLASRYQQALAQPTRRKLALLVGINQYPEQVCDCSFSRGAALNGCLTDVELQRELLIYRFGFQPADILTLTDQAATRQGIAAAFLAHLTDQAQPGDVVIFHFSGLGSQITTDETKQLRNSLVPVDGVLPTADNPVIRDLLEDTLGLLLRSLATEQVVSILDTSYAPLGKLLQGNLRIRSRPNVPSGQVDEAELDLQEQLVQRTGVSISQVQTQWRSGQLPGVVLAAASPQHIATEAQWNGFSAGLFTQALTQQLWWTAPATTLRVSLNQAIGIVKQAAGVEQQPNLSGQKIQSQLLPTSLNASAIAGADGVIRAITEDNRIQLWLAGLPAIVLENYGASLLTVVDPTAASLTQRPLLQIRGRDGLTFRARLYRPDPLMPAPRTGQLVQEAVRMLPRSMGLTVALDASLERIERVDATSAFAGIPRVSAVIAGEQPADFLFGKTQPPSTLTASLPPPLSADPQALPSPETSPAQPPTKSGYGLFSLGRDAIPNTLIQDDEAVKTAVHRIAPQLRTLLATKLLRATENRGSSRLGVRATLELVAPQERLVMQQETIRAPWPAPESKLMGLFISSNGPLLPINSRIQYRLHNYSDRPVYFMLLGLDTHGNAIALYPAANRLAAKPIADENLIPAGETLTVPQTTLSDWVLQAPTGLAETHILFSRAPFIQAYQVLETEMRSKTEARRVTLVVNPLEVVQAVLQDLHQASLAALSGTDVLADSYALDVNTWATLSFVYQVVAPQT